MKNTKFFFQNNLKNRKKKSKIKNDVTIEIKQLHFYSIKSMDIVLSHSQTRILC